MAPSTDLGWSPQHIYYKGRGTNYSDESSFPPRNLFLLIGMRSVLTAEIQYNWENGFVGCPGRSIDWMLKYWLSQTWTMLAAANNTTRFKNESAMSCSCLLLVIRMKFMSYGFVPLHNRVISPPYNAGPSRKWFPLLEASSDAWRWWEVISRTLITRIGLFLSLKLLQQEKTTTTL